jgi:rhamnose transport system permease protein
MSAILNTSSRALSDTATFSVRHFFFQWEWLLAVVLLAINIINASLSPHYLNFANIMSALQTYGDKMILIFPMMMIIVLGEIDISIASTMALSSVLMGVGYSFGVPMPLAMAFALIIGTLCGFINGIILARYKELASMIVTLSTMIIYRGIASIILEDRAAGKFPGWFSFLGWGSIGHIPFIFVVFLIESVIFAYIIHLTKFGRCLYAAGNNAEAARYSGIHINRNKVIVFTVMGLFAAIAGMFLASKMGSVRPSMAKGYELDVIAMVVLGGVSTSGGKGRVAGIFLASFIIISLRYGLGLINMSSQLILIIIGVLLIVAAAIPNMKRHVGRFPPNAKFEESPTRGPQNPAVDIPQKNEEELK